MHAERLSLMYDRHHILKGRAGPGRKGSALCNTCFMQSLICFTKERLSLIVAVDEREYFVCLLTHQHFIASGFDIEPQDRFRV